MEREQLVSKWEEVLTNRCSFMEVDCEMLEISEEDPYMEMNNLIEQTIDYLSK